MWIITCAWVVHLIWRTRNLVRFQDARPFNTKALDKSLLQILCRHCLGHIAHFNDFLTFSLLDISPNLERLIRSSQVVGLPYCIFYKCTLYFKIFIDLINEKAYEETCPNEKAYVHL